MPKVASPKRLTNIRRPRTDFTEDPEGKDPMVGENGGGAAPGSDEAAGEEGA
ncbi:hypothetical protein F2Q68_00033507 [Brassica cretica]|uniref:Uncharacterized protein n=1 Tax=Brassica cretica TaxID=69181 RepID=A0A8S9H7J1_BRACR|nr:hypothetical protein F2Q68_00033507 [Brassica cretica]